MSGQTPAYAEGLLRHASFSPAVIAPTGRTIYVAGQLPLDAGSHVVGEGIVAQTERVWFQIESILAAAGASLDDVVSVRAYTTAPEHVNDIVAIRQRLFAGRTPPASALVVVAGLAVPGALVEIEAVAVIAESD